LLKRRPGWAAISADYAQYHQTAGNRLCHLLGIPLIVYAIVCWTRWPAGNPVPLAAGFLPVYFYWGWPLGLGMTAELALLTVLCRYLPAWSALAAFIVGWIFQLLGHKVFEGKSPAFTRNLAHLLVGPAWIVEKIILSK